MQDESIAHLVGTLVLRNRELTDEIERLKRVIESRPGPRVGTPPVPPTGAQVARPAPDYSHLPPSHEE